MNAQNPNPPYSITEAIKLITMYATDIDPQQLAGGALGNDMVLFHGEVPLNNGLRTGEDFFYPPTTTRYLVVDVHTSYDPVYVDVRHIGIMTS